MRLQEELIEFYMVAMASAFPLFSKEGSDIVTSFLDLVDSKKQFTVSTAESDTKAPTISCPSDDTLYCTSCKVTLQDRQDQLLHYRLDWHRMNLKRKLQGRSPLSADAFEEITSDVSSISGSDSETSDSDSSPSPSQQRCSQFITFTTAPAQRLYMVHRTVLFSAKHVPSTKEEVAELVTSLARPQVWIVLMRSAGHFAGAVFKGSEVVTHKTFHRYTVRAKRGTIQSARDAQGHQPKSAGASLRRHNEAALEQEIQDLVLKWSEHIEESSAIFIRAPVHSQATFFSGKKPLFSKGDMKLRTLPFPVRRPTFTEVKRVHSKLATLYHPLLVNDAPKNSTKPRARVDEPHPVPSEAVTSVDSIVGTNSGPTETSDETVALTETNVDYPDTRITLKFDSPLKHPVNKNVTFKADIQNHDDSCTPTVGDASTPSLQEQFQITCTRGDLQRLSEFLAHSKLLYPVAGITDGLSSPETIANDNDAITNSELTDFHLLHVASTQGHWKLVFLLLAYGADPAVKDQQGKLSYNLSRDKKTRDSFRKFMGKYPDAYDYAKAQVPSPLTDDIELARKEKLNEKKKAQKRAKKQKEVEQKVEEKQQQTVENLSLREKCAIAAERRILNSSPASSLLSKNNCCSNCEIALAGIVPFEKYEYKYCSMSCLREHRTKLNKQ